MTNSSSRTGLCAALAGATLLVTLLGAPKAEAQTAIAADLDYAAPLDSDAKPGVGFAIRAGRQLHAPLLVLVPELVFADHTFTNNGPSIYQGLVGLRLGIGEVLRPGVFAHVGLGHTPAFEGQTGLSYDAGAFLDLTILPLLDLGVHAAYNRMNLGSAQPAGDPTPKLEWVTVGAHAALIF